MSLPDYPTVIPTDAITASGTNIKYIVDDTAPFAIYAWNLDNPNPGGEPFWYQPHDMNGADWSDQATALAFAESHLQQNFTTPPSS